MSEKGYKRILVTAALPYANGPLHIGHLAGAYLPADLYCRYQRLRERDVVFVCGSDELGVAIMVRARSEGITPQQLVDRYHPIISDSFERFGMSFDYYGRTTTDVHRETSQDFFRTLARQGAFSIRTDKQLYDPDAGIFLADRFVIGTCPSCGYEDAYGDQCEKCGSTLSPSELLNPRSALSDAVPEMRETTHWYLPLGKYQKELEDWIATRNDWKPNVLGQVGSWLKEGLRERAITRDVPWGVPVPQDAADQYEVDASGKVIYVWFDAPIGYISATREWAASKGDPDRWKTYWKDADTKLIHFIGKDNIVFHCLMFPAMLMAHGDYVLPENVPANEFLNIEGRKLSTSRGWAVWLHEYLDVFPPDLLRYALATMLPEAKDSDFNWHEFQTRVNSELADVLGNFVNRTMTFATRYFEGNVPELANPSDVDLEVLRELRSYPDRIGHSYEVFRNREAVFETMALARLGNKYFNDTEPWHTRKSDMKACGNTIHICLQLCASLSVLMDPVLPFSADRLRRMLRLEGIMSSLPKDSPSGSICWESAGEPLLSVDHALGVPEILFTKIDDEAIQMQIEKLTSSAEGSASTPGDTSSDAGIASDASTEAANDAVQGEYEKVSEQIVYDDFARLDLRMGTVRVAESLPKSKKLIRLEIDLGFETRQILAGAAEHFQPEELVGRRVAIVANLAPRKMMGLESQGMVLMAEDRDGRLSLLSSDGEDGSIIT